MQATPPFLGARLLAPSGGERAGPLPGRPTYWPNWATSNFGRTDLRRTTNNFFLAYVLNKHHAYHDPSEIDFARPTQASSGFTTIAKDPSYRRRASARAMMARAGTTLVVPQSGNGDVCLENREAWRRHS